MPTVTISAFDNKHLPSPVLLSTWIEDWKTEGGDWENPATAGASITITVSNIDIAALRGIVDPKIAEYNRTHDGKNVIQVDVV